MPPAAPPRNDARQAPPPRSRGARGPRGFAARAGRWSARNRKKAIFGWLAFVAIAVVLGGAVGTETLTEDGNGESARAEQMLNEAGFPDRSGESVMLTATKPGETARSPEVQAAVADLARRLEASPDILDVSAPPRAGPSDLISENGRSALVTFEFAGSEEDAVDKLDPVLAAVDEVRAENPGVEIVQFGAASAEKAFMDNLGDDMQRAELLAIPITLLVLLIAFGSLVAAGVPLLLGLSAVAATLGVIGLVSQISPVSEIISSTVLLIGLAVGVDYSLFYLKREREERAAGRGPQAAIEAAAATSGRAVFVSGLTVIIAMAGMYLIGDPTFASLATGTILVVAVAVVGSLTVLPAVLSALGDRVEKGRVPFLRRRNGNGGGRVWNAIVGGVLRRPLASAIAAGGLMIALAIPAFGLHTVMPGVDSLPDDMPAVQAYERITAAFPAEKPTADVVVKAGDVRSPEIQAAGRAMVERAAAEGIAVGPPSTEISRDGTVAEVKIPLPGSGTDEVSTDALKELRADVIPGTLGTVGAEEVAVGGETAGAEDFNQLIGDRGPLVFAFVLGLAFLLLLAVFRSVVIPTMSIVLNLLSVGAAYGVLVLIFQEGVGERLLGFESVGGITAWLPLFMFVVLFGLSMDYHVFILSRIKEAADDGRDTSAAIRHGIVRTAGVVTSAATVMVAVFAIFGSLDSLELKMMGIGLAVAVFLDATIVRAVLLPATMQLLGRRNWYLPRWLRWLPVMSFEAPAPDARARRAPRPDGPPARRDRPEPAAV